jgi:MinD superfamily P-loop ATPase
MSKRGKPMKRKIVNINEALCNGCGNCIPKCAEGALQIVDGKAKIIKETYCDGLGACLGHAPKVRLQLRSGKPQLLAGKVHEHLKNKQPHPTATSQTTLQKPQWPIKLNLVP